MIFLGDFVFPFEKEIDFFEFEENFINENKVVNLESLILNPEHFPIITSGIALHSSKNIFRVLKKLNVSSVGLANNHITDYEYNIESLREELLKNGISSSGAGKNLNSAIQPALPKDDRFSYAIYSFGWNAVDCRYAGPGHSGVAPLDEELIIQIISKAKINYPKRKIILFLHWNYEFEYYPQPADRKLAFAAIDAGADAIYGHHSHMVGVFENYKNKPIFYSLGNFYIPEYNFGGFDLSYGVLAKTGLGAAYEEKIEEIQLYWLENNSNKLTLIKKEILINSKKIINISSMYQNDMVSYSKWFKQNRRKKKLLPIFQQHNKSYKNNMSFKFLRIRNFLVHKLTSSGLRTRSS